MAANIKSPVQGELMVPERLLGFWVLWIIKSGYLGLVD